MGWNKKWLKMIRSVEAKKNRKEQGRNNEQNSLKSLVLITFKAYQTNGLR